MNTPRRLARSALFLVSALALPGAEPSAVPAWAEPGSAHHVQVAPPPDFHRPSRNFDGPIGIFSGQSDVGSAVVPGSASYDAATGRYTVNSAGYNVWYTRDEFRYLWKKMSGDVSLAADISFPDPHGYGDRKAVLIIRQSLDDDAKEAIVALHGLGMIQLGRRAETNTRVTDMEYLGFEALATSSGAAAATLGRVDGQLSREEALAHSRTIVSSTALPVSADLEKGFGDAPAVVAETIRLAADAGLAGCSIEDSTKDPSKPIFDLSLATERIAAAAEAARALPFPFTLTARSENFLHGRPDLDDTIRRLQAFERAGADVLFAPGLPDLAAVRTVCSSVSKPVNFMAGIRGKSFPVAELAAAGVKRVSLATSLYRAAVSGLIAAAREVRERGTFGYLDQALTTAELIGFLKR